MADRKRRVRVTVEFIVEVDEIRRGKYPEMAMEGAAMLCTDAALDEVSSWPGIVSSDTKNSELLEN